MSRKHYRHEETIPIPYKSPEHGARYGYNKQGVWVRLPDKGGPTEDDPERPYCKPDQSCCDFCCGN